MAILDRGALADFLRVRREALRPADVGLPTGQRRRTPGLRREEVAVLADMSTDYYARLEQQRGPQPSLSVIETIARALRLTRDERDHLLRLAGHEPEPHHSRTSHVEPPLLRVLDRLDDTPAFVVSDLGEVLAQNSTGIALLGDRMHLEGNARSAYYRWFTDPAERSQYPERDHAYQSELQAAALRAAIGAGGEDDRTRSMVAELLERSEEFRELWGRQLVRAHHGLRKTLVHPELGEIDVDCQVLTNDNTGQSLLVMTATPGSQSEEKLRLLAVLGAQEFAADPR